MKVKYLKYPLAFLFFLLTHFAYSQSTYLPASREWQHFILQTGPDPYAGSQFQETDATGKIYASPSWAVNATLFSAR